MKAFKGLFDPFTLTAFLVIGVTIYTFYHSFVWRDFPTFLTEEEIAETIEAEFPLFVDYL